MDAVFLVMHKRKENVAELTRQLIRAFHNAGIAVAAEEWLWRRMGDEAPCLFAALDASACEAVVSVGGDGTLLRANVTSMMCDLPLLGVNVGTVGFLAEVELEQLSWACERLRDSKFTLEKRMMLDAAIGDKHMLALNDVVLSRGEYARLIGVDAWVGEEHIGRYIADGLIIATPTGSTGYSLSAGGPIVCPELECMLLTPICAHSLQHRPVIASADRHITVRLDGSYCSKACVSVDGQANGELFGETVLTVTRSGKYARFIRLEPRGFFSTIRVKLAEWSSPRA